MFRHGFDSRLVHLKGLKNGGFSGFFILRYDKRYDFLQKRYDRYDKKVMFYEKGERLNGVLLVKRL